MSSTPPMLTMELAVDPRRGAALCGSPREESWMGKGYCEAGDDAAGDANVSSDPRRIGEDIVSIDGMAMAKANAGAVRCLA